jgi:lysyl-tRNA synthetase class 2
MDNLENNGCTDIQAKKDFHELKCIRIQKLLDLQRNGEDPFKIVKYDQTHHSTDISDGFVALENTRVSIAGRLMSGRLMGQAAFCDVLDQEGRIQVYIRKEDIGNEVFNKFKYLIDIDD